MTQNVFAVHLAASGFNAYRIHSHKLSFLRFNIFVILDFIQFFNQFEGRYLFHPISKAKQKKTIKEKKK